MARVGEGLIWGAIKDHAVAGTSSVGLFYSPELEPDPSALAVWVMLEVDYNDEASHAGEFRGDGQLKVFINARRKSGSVINIYRGRTVADEMAAAFNNATITVDQSAVTKGYIRFDVAHSRAMGEADGVIEHYWWCDFFVNEE